MLPHEYPHRSTVYWYLNKWTKNGTWKRINDDFVCRVRKQVGKEASPSLVMIAAQSVKTGCPLGEVGGVAGFDGGKHVHGRKRHIAVDTLGLLLLVLVTAASVQEANSAELLGPKMQGKFPRLKKILVDGGYKDKFITWFKDQCQWVVEVAKRREGAVGFEYPFRR
jgi:putative transposase